MTTTWVIHNGSIDIDLDNSQEWVFQKSDDEKASVSVKIDASYNRDENHLYFKDTNGGDIEGFTLVCKSDFDVAVIYDCLRDLVGLFENNYPELEKRKFE